MVVVVFRARKATDKLKLKKTINKQVDRVAVQWSLKAHQEILRLGADVKVRQLLMVKLGVLVQEPLVLRIHCLLPWTPTPMV